MKEQEITGNPSWLISMGRGIAAAIFVTLVAYFLNRLFELQLDLGELGLIFFLYTSLIYAGKFGMFNFRPKVVDTFFEPRSALRTLNLN